MGVERKRERAVREGENERGWMEKDRELMNGIKPEGKMPYKHKHTYRIHSRLDPLMTLKG